MKHLIQYINWYARLVRLPNLIILALSQYFVRYSLIMPVYDSRNAALHTGNVDFALLVFSSMLIAAAGYIINDYFDIRIDAVNRPNKIILHKFIRLRTAIIVYYVLAILGCLVGIFVAFKVGYIFLGGVHIIISVALWFYSLKYKRIPFAGNFTVAILAAVSPAIIWLFEFFALTKDGIAFTSLIKYFPKINIFIAGFAILAFLVTLIREMIKDIEDIEGDRSFRCRTLPIVYGIPLMRKIILAITGFTLGFTVFVTVKLFQWEFRLLAWYFAVVIGLFWFYYLLQFFKAKEKKDYHFLSTILKILILAGVLSMQLLNINF
jgi:4-hydroxybenzoate polyprenyltransferase